MYSSRIFQELCSWSRRASACSGLEWGLGSQSETEAGSRQWRHQILTARPVVGDKGPDPSALQKRISTKTESTEASKVFIRREKRVQYVWIDTWADSEGESLSCALVAVWIIFLGLFSSFPLANQFDLPGSQSMFGVSQDPPLCVHTSLSRDGFYQQGVWVAHPLTEFSSGLQGAFLRMYGQGSLLTSRNMWSEQGPAASLNCPAVLILEWSFSLLGMNFQSLYLGGVGGWGCPSTSYLKSWREKFQVSKRFNIQCY